MNVYNHAVGPLLFIASGALTSWAHLHPFYSLHLVLLLLFRPFFLLLLLRKEIRRISRERALFTCYTLRVFIASLVTASDPSGAFDPRTGPLKSVV